MRKTLTALLLIAALVTPQAEAKSTPQSIEALRDAQGRIHCTIFSINAQEHLWMTAHHCVVNHDENSQAPYDEFYVNNEQATIYKDFPDMDAAIIRTEKQSAPALRLSSNEPKVGDSVYVLGHGLGWEALTKFAGSIVLPSLEAEGQFWTIFDMTVFPGHSGSPIFNAKDEVISICQIRFTFGRASGGATWVDLQRETGAYWRK